MEIRAYSRQFNCPEACQPARPPIEPLSRAAAQRNYAVLGEAIRNGTQSHAVAREGQFLIRLQQLLSLLKFRGTRGQLPATSAQNKAASSTGGLQSTLIHAALDTLPEGYSAITVGEDGIALALPEAEALQFGSFLKATAGYFGGMAGGEIGGFVGGAIGANASQTAALEAAGGAFGSAAASGAVAAATTAGASAGGVGAAAASSAAAAWPVAVVIAAYTAFNNIKEMKSAVGGGRLTDDEIKVALDSFGIEHFVEKATPDEMSEFLPEEIDYAIHPHRLFGKALFGSGKHEHQIVRDRVRKHLEKIGLAEKIGGSHHLKLADGSYYNIGLDGEHRLQNLKEGERRPYNTDSQNPFTHQVTGWANPLAAILTGGQQKSLNDFAGYFVNAALSNAQSLDDAKANVRVFYESSGISAEQVPALLQKLAAEEKITGEEYQAYLGGYFTLLR